MIDDNKAAHFRRRRRVLHIGRALIEGPRALFPPPALDDFGWLEPALRIELDSPSLDHSESVIVFADDTMNRDDGFLDPIVRYAAWQQGRDRKEAPLWPTIDIALGRICGGSLKKVKRLAAGLQRKARKLPFIPFGLSTDRSVPDQPGEMLGWLTLFLANGAQALTFSFCLLPDDPFSRHVVATFDELKGLLAAIDRTGWRERYSANLNSPELGVLWDWQGEVPDPPPIFKDA